MSQHTKIKKGSVTIAAITTFGTTTIDMEVSTEDMRRLEDDYGLSSGDWYKMIIPTIVKTNDAAGGALNEPKVTITNPSDANILVRLDVDTNPNKAATYDVWLKYPHSISR